MTLELRRAYEKRTIVFRSSIYKQITYKQYKTSVSTNKKFVQSFLYVLEGRSRLRSAKEEIQKFRKTCIKSIDVTEKPWHLEMLTRVRLQCYLVVCMQFILNFLLVFCRDFERPSRSQKSSGRNLFQWINFICTVYTLIFTYKHWIYASKWPSNVTQGHRWHCQSVDRICTTSC